VTEDCPEWPLLTLPLVDPEVDPDAGAPPLVVLKLRMDVGEGAGLLILLSIDVLWIELRPKRPIKLLIGFSFLVWPASNVGDMGSSPCSEYMD
jgi:hypothetical protein